MNASHASVVRGSAASAVRRRVAVARGSTTGHVDVQRWLGWLLLAFTAALLLAACGGSSDPVIAPSITSQPASVTTTVGDSATFSVTADGSGPLGYQWRRNGADIAGATGASHTTPALVAADNGAQFSVVVSNSAGSVTSAAATLTAGPAIAPSITAHPGGTSVVAPATATFSVIATGSAPLNFQWQRNGAAIAGATGASYTTPATTSADGGTLYAVVVSNAGGQAISSDARLLVTTAAVAPTIATQPVGASVNAGQTASFSVSASGTTPLAYQWRRNGAAIAGATGAAYTTPAVAASDNGALYSVVVGNIAGSVTSADAALIVTAAAIAPAITAQPASLTVVAGSAATFSVSATGSAPLVYQWRRNGSAIGGASSASYTLNSAAPADNGALFSVEVSNAAGAATSQAATLTVTPVASDPDIVALLAAKNCNACHRVDSKLIGPSWIDVATRYTGQAGAEAYLASRIRTGGSGVWGAVPMPPNAQVTDAEAATIARWLLSGSVVVPSGAPAITAQPSAAFVIEGQTATFNVTATGGAPLTYQWRRNGINVAGATSPTYTTPPTVAGDNGAVFSVSVANFAGTAVSTGVTLTVIPPAAVVTLRVAGMGTAVVDSWCGRLATESANTLQCQSATIAGTVPTPVDRVRSGAIDIAFSALSRNPGQFPIMAVFELPFMANSASAGSQAAWDFYVSRASAEFIGVKPLFMSAGDAAQIHARAGPIRSLADMPGLKVAAPAASAGDPSSTSNALLRAGGASALALALGEMRQALETGVVDAALLSWGTMNALTVEEVATFHIETDPSRPSTYASMSMLVMNAARYASLTAAQQQAIDRLSGRAASAIAGQTWDQWAVAARNRAIARGNTFFTLPPSVVDDWISRTSTTRDAWVDSMNQRGLPGDAMLQEARDLLNLYR